HPSAESPIQPSACSPRWLSPRAAGNTPGASKATSWMLSKMCDSAVLNLFKLLKDLPPRITRSQLGQTLAVNAAHIVKVFFNLAQQFPGLLYQITRYIAVSLSECHAGTASRGHSRGIHTRQSKPARLLWGEVELRCLVVTWVFLRQQVLESFDRPWNLFNLG